VEFSPILSAMRRNKMGALIIVVQTAITLAILCNSIFIIRQRLDLSDRPSGTQEADIFTIANQWVGQPSDLSSRAQADLAALRSVPGVIDAYISNSYPLSNGGSDDGVSLEPTDRNWLTQSALYFADEHGLPTLGLKLIAGRNFEVSEIAENGNLDNRPPAAVIITRALAMKLFSNGEALGKAIYLVTYKTKVPIVGIVDRLQQPWVRGTNHNIENSMLLPYRFIERFSYYIVRARPGQLDAVMKNSQERLLALNRGRVIERTRSFSESRRIAYRDDRGLAIMLAAVSIVLLAITAFGIVGITSFWVTQRRRQIGIRRAMGATRTAIVRYFQTENFMIAVAGAVLGVVLALTLNIWMAGRFEMARLGAANTIGAAVIVLLLGQIAVLWPAHRAASISPVVAIRDN
jgi:putative ABC transport system permease protein